jgi:hypothetical protein
MPHTTTLSDYELGHAATASAHEIVDATDTSPAKATKKVVAADTEGVETA